MNRFSAQIVEAVETVMDGFTAEELDALVNDEDLRALLQDWQAARDGGSSSLAELSIDADDIAGFIGEDGYFDGDDVAGDPGGGDGGTTVEGVNDPADYVDEIGDGSDGAVGGGSSSSPPPSAPSPAPGTPADGETGSGSDDDGKDDAGNRQGVSLPGLDSSIANKISAKDTVFLLQVYRRFPAPEREELIDLYREGGNRSLIKDQVKSRLTDEELERVVGIALKILD